VEREHQEMLDLIARLLSARLDVAPTQQNDAVEDAIILLKKHGRLSEGDPVVAPEEAVQIEDRTEVVARVLWEHVAVHAGLVRGAFWDWLSEDRKQPWLADARTVPDALGDYGRERERTLEAAMTEAISVAKRLPIGGDCRAIIAPLQVALASPGEPEGQRKRIEWWDEPDRNARYYRHVGCDEGNQHWVVPLDDCPAPTREDHECVRCALIVPLIARDAQPDHGPGEPSEDPLIEEPMDYRPIGHEVRSALRDDAVHHMATIAGQLRLAARDHGYVGRSELERMGDALADSCQRCRVVLQEGESNGRAEALEADLSRSPWCRGQTGHPLT